MQIQPDYSHQLEEIAKALNRSSIPQWMVVLESALVGAFFGIAGQLLLKLFDNWWEIRKMRRVLYWDLLPMFLGLEAIRVNPYLGLEEQIRTFLKFDGEAYLKAHQDVYMQLPEKLAAETLYAAYHRIVDVHDDNKTLLTNIEAAKRLLADLVEENRLQRRYIKKSPGGAAAERLLERLHAIYEDSERRSKRLSGTTEPIDGK